MAKWSFRKAVGFSWYGETESEISSLLCHSSHCDLSFEAVRQSKSRFRLQLFSCLFVQQVLWVRDSSQYTGEKKITASAIQIFTGETVKYKSSSVSQKLCLYTVVYHCTLCKLANLSMHSQTVTLQLIFDIFGNMLICFLAGSYMRRLTLLLYLSCRKSPESQAGYRRNRTDATNKK